MPKLHLKRTPQEEAEHSVHKRRKRESKRRKAEAYPGHRSAETSRKWDSSDSDVETYAGTSSEPISPETFGSRYKPDYEAIRAEIEEVRFRQKMAEAFEDDDRLDSLETRMNQYAHVPGRWKGRYYDAEYLAGDEDISKLDPRRMDDEEYVEWIRAGMYRKTHVREYEEQQQKKALRDARRAQEKALKAEIARLAKLAEEERRRKKLEKEIRRSDYAREEYHLRWKALLASPSDDDSRQSLLSFNDIPWPIVSAHRQKADKKATSKSNPPLTILLEDLTADAIASFLVPPTSGTSSIAEKDKKDRKDKLRETFLRFHPDKFEGRLMKRVRESDQETVRQAIGVVVRALNALMGE
ncbi:hypothetical protein B0H10DRAFT_2165863 [Mycena sp. CBHHK59/15]|nr:hypothetical protein B0H10DRAFT_2165863 [Mycena sp. CBHHK59/15]